jgi:hypothetical protein
LNVAGKRAEQQKRSPLPKTLLGMSQSIHGETYGWVARPGNLASMHARFNCWGQAGTLRGPCPRCSFARAT